MPAASGPTIAPVAVPLADIAPTSTPVTPADPQSLTAAPLPDLELLADPVASPVGQTRPAPNDCAVAPDVQPEDVRENLALPSRPGSPVPADAPKTRPGQPGPAPTDVDGKATVTKPVVSPKPMIALVPTPAVVVAAAPTIAAPAVSPKGAATPADPAPAEEGIPAESEDDAVIVATPPAMIPLPIPAEVASPPPAVSAAPAKSHDEGAATPAAGTPVTAAAIGTPAATLVQAGNADTATSPDRAAPVAASGLRPVREEAVTADAKPAAAAAHPAHGAFAALVEPKPVAAAPAAPTAPPPPVPEARVMAEPGRMGHEMAVAIARHTAEGGGEALTVRLNPAEFGRIDVTLSFDDRGTLRAVLAAETPAALDVLRRDSADLGRALSDAGMRTDAQSFRFDTRQGGADAGGQGAQGQQRWQPAATPRTLATATAELPEPEYRPLRTRGGVDLMA